MARFWRSYLEHLAVTGGALGFLALVLGYLSAIEEWGRSHRGAVVLGLAFHLVAYWVLYLERAERRDMAQWRRRMLDDYVRRDDERTR